MKGSRSTMVRYLAALALLVPVFTTPAPQRAAAAEPVTMTSQDIFKKWVTSQQIRREVNFNELKRGIDARYVEYIVKQMPMDILPQVIFMFPRTAEFKEMKPEEVREVTARVQEIYGFLERDIPGLVDYLLKNKFAGEMINKREMSDEDKGNTSQVCLKYRRFLETLLHNDDIKVFDSTMNGIANRFLEYCFSPRSFDHFSKVLSSKNNYSAARFLYEIIWYYLARGEWKSWHQNTLANLKREFDRGKEVTYIAGGSDIYQLIAHGIYRIRNIDPIYPTQTKYYAEGWDFLALGRDGSDGIGDRIVFDDPASAGKGIVMRRLSYKKNGTLVDNELIHGSRVTIPKSVTVWSIEDAKGTRLGTYTLERRFVTPQDFTADPGRAYLISFNELFFIMTAGREGWGVDPRKFPKGFAFNVKQLRAPLTYNMLMNIRTIQESDYPNRFGSSVIGN